MQLLNRIISLKYFSAFIKSLVLFALIFLIITGLIAHSTEANFLKYLRNFNIANLLVWSYWWPLLVASSIFFGRVWCMICPVELITSLASKMGLKRNRPKWLKTGWVITILYVIILFIGINGFAIHRNPRYMAIYLITLVSLSIIIGIIYKKNTFCKYVCPIGILLGLYSRFSFLGWRVKSPQTCTSCNDKSCIEKSFTYNTNAKSCGVGLFPKNITTNSDCILCGGCRKTCNNNNVEKNTLRPNPGFVKVKLKENFFSNIKLSSAQTLFTIILSGFVIYEILSEWTISKSILLSVPKFIINYFAITNSIFAGIIKSSLIFIILPLIIWSVPFIVAKFFKEKITFANYFKIFSAAFIPIMAAAHLCKALLKTTSRIPYFEHVFFDIDGLTNTQLFLEGQLHLFKLGPIPQTIISLLLIVIIITGIWLSKITVDYLNKTTSIKNKATIYLIPVIYGSIFLVTIVLWRFI